MIDYLLLSFTVLLSSLQIGNSMNSILIHQENVQEDIQKLTCTISGENAASFKTYLHCPLIDNTICYTDCTVICRVEFENCKKPAELNPIIDCKYNIQGNDHVIVYYLINTGNIKNKTGDWYCSFAGINSKVIRLKFAEKRNISPTPSKTQTIKTKSNLVVTKAIQTNVVTISQVKILPENPLRNNPITEAPIVKENLIPRSDIDSNNDINFKTFITRFQVVMGIIVFLSLSIILNFILCIRDALIKQFIDNIKTNVSSNKCLLCCICQNDIESLSATAGLDRVLSRESDHNSHVASLSSRSGMFPLEVKRPLISNAYFDTEVNTNPQILRSSSLQSPEMTPRISHINHNSYRLAGSREYPQPIFLPYYFSQTHPGAPENLDEITSQGFQFTTPTSISTPNPRTTATTENNGNQNNMDLIRHCENSDEPQQTETLPID